MSIYQKTSAAPVDYVIDWGAGWLRGAAIVASHWSVDEADPAGVVACGRPAGAGRTGATLSGGVPGRRYTVRGEVLLSDGRRGSRALAIAIGRGR